MGLVLFQPLPLRSNYSKSWLQSPAVSILSLAQWMGIQTEGSELTGLRWQLNTGGFRTPPDNSNLQAGRTRSPPTPAALAGLSWPLELEAMQDQE